MAAKKQAKVVAKDAPPEAKLPDGLKRVNIFKFGSSWCGPCQEMAKSRVLERFVEAHSDVALHILDVDKHEALSDSYDIKSMPTIVFVDANGDEFERINGIPTMARLIKEYRECVKELKAEDAERASKEVEPDEDEEEPDEAEA